MPRFPPFLKRKLILIPSGLIAAYALLGFLVLPRVLRARLPEQLGGVLKRPVTIGDISFNPFALELVVRDFKVTERDGAPFVAFRTLRVNASFFALLRGRLGFDAIALDGPSIAVTLLKDGSLSFADLLETGEATAAPAGPEEPKKDPLTIAIADFNLTDGAFTFHDLTRAEPFTAQLVPLTLALSDFTTETGRGSRYSFKAKLGDAQLEYDGDFSARPLKSSGQLSMKGIRLDANDRPLLSMRALELKGLDYQRSPAQPTPTSVALETLRLSGFKLKVQRDEAGDYNLEQLTQASTPAGAAPPEPEKKAAGGGSAPSRTFSLKSLVLDDFNVDWLDKTTAPAFATSLTRLSGSITNLSYPGRRTVSIKLAGRLDQAPLTVNGTLLPKSDAPASDVQVALEGYDLPHATPYSVRYVAQPINTGKLSLNVVSKMAEKKITAQTHTVIDQLEFGDAVPNPGSKARSLPWGWRPRC